MSILLNCQSLSKSFSSKALFSGVTFGVFEGDRLGLIGANGSGKTTLLRILAGIEEADEGEVSRRRHLKVAYIPQQDSFDNNDSVFEAAKKYVEDSGIRVADVDISINRSLSKVGFEDMNLMVSTLSGGWRKRLSIGAGIALEPDILMLDEPTNHLDIEGVLWLEKTLKNSRFAWVLISHDRYFLENTTTKVAEINHIYKDGLMICDGSYSEFIQKRNEFHMDQASYAQSLANKVRREVEWLKRGPKARSTKAKSRIDEAHSMMGELSDVKSRLKTTSANIDFSGSNRKTKKLIVVKDASIELGGKKLVENLDLTLSPGMRLGLLGANGSGKSTLLKLLIKELAPDKGEVTHADKLKWVYFEQSRASLDLTLTLKQALSEYGDSVIYRGRSTHVASWAKKFQFRPDQLDTLVGKLSGGEQARVVIARLMLQEADVLLLDEPTNDLDIPTLEVLEESLEEFPGSLVLVSHDRFMLGRVCNVYVGLDGGGTSRIYADFSQWQKTLRAPSDKKKVNESNKSSASPKKRNKLSYIDQRDLDMIEAKILKAESELELAEQKVNDPKIATNTSELIKATQDFESAQKQVEVLYIRWAELETMASAE